MKQETQNAEDSFAVTIVKAETIVGHGHCNFCFIFNCFPMNLSFATQVPYSAIIGRGNILVKKLPQRIGREIFGECHSK